MGSKKKVLVIIGFLVTSITFAQNEARFGINAGLTYSKFRGNQIIENADAKVDFLVGVSFEYYLKENLSIKTNLNYERKSFNTPSYIGNEYDFIANQNEITTTHDYLSLPILIKYEFGSSKTIFINGGSFIGFLLSNKARLDGYPDEDYTSLYKKIDIGLSFGIGKKFRLNDNNNLNVEIRDNLGLINTSDVYVKDNGTIKTNSLNLILVWDFQI